MILTSLLVAGVMTPAIQVEAGDTYKSIAENQGVTIQQLERANNRPVGGFDIIYPNDKVIIPKTSQEATQGTNAQSNVTNNDQQTNGLEAKNIASGATQNETASQPAQSTGNGATVKVSFYDPAVLGSNMGYGGVATNNAVYPKGTVLRITLADGTVYTRTVNDTGTFVYGNPNQIDLALPNSQVPSYGVTTATVEVIG